MKVVGWAPEKVTAEIEKTAMDRMEKAGEVVAAKARVNLTAALTVNPSMPGRKTKKPWEPMSKGALMKTIRVTRLKGDPKQNIRVYAGSREKGGAFYAHMVEYGTTKMKARPFLRPALNQSKGAIMSIMENG